LITSIASKMRAALWGAALISFGYLSCFILLPSAGWAQQNPSLGFNPARLANGGQRRGRGCGMFLEARASGAENSLVLYPLLLKTGPFNPGRQNSLDAAWKSDCGLILPRHGLRFAASYRGELHMRANRDSLDILWLIGQKRDLPTGRVFKVDLKSRGFSAFGVEVSKGIGFGSLLPGFCAGLTARYLQGEMIQEGKISGQLIPTGKKSYRFDLFTDYVYDRNLLYERQETIPGSGAGYSFDLGLGYSSPSKRLRGEILFRDLGGRIFWKDTPYTTAWATSKTKEYDSQGYQIYRPTIQGYEGYKNFNQKIPLKTDLLLSCQLGPFTLIPSVSLIEAAEKPILWLDLNYQIGKNYTLYTGYNLNYQAFSLGAACGSRLSLAISMSDIDLSATRLIGLSLLLRYP